MSKCLKRRKAQELSEANKVARHQRAKELLKKYPAHCVDFIWFLDEKLFTVASTNSSQSDCIYVRLSVRKRDVSERRLLRARSTFSKSVMVTVAVSSLDCIFIHFIEPGVNINGSYYRNIVLRQMLLPDIGYISDDTFIFQQDSAPAHCTRATVEFLARETTRIHFTQAVTARFTGLEAR